MKIKFIEPTFIISFISSEIGVEKCDIRRLR